MNGNNSTGSLSYNLGLNDAKIENVINKELAQLKLSLSNQIYYKIKSMMREIYPIFTTIIKNAFQEVFTEIYGTGYDVESLYDALTFIMGSNLVPEFYFDKNKFYFNDSFLKQQRKFNENSRSYASFRKFDDPNFYLGNVEDFIEEENLYNENGDALDEDEIWEEMQYEYLNITPTSRVLREGTIYSVDEAYKIARDRALYVFNAEYISQIKPRMMKKYKINF